MITRSDSPWLKVSNAKKYAEPEISVNDMCDNDFESFSSHDELTTSSEAKTSETDSSVEAENDSDEERAKAAEVYGRTPSP